MLSEELPRSHFWPAWLAVTAAWRPAGKKAEQGHSLSRAPPIPADQPWMQAWRRPLAVREVRSHLLD